MDRHHFVRFHAAGRWRAGLLEDERVFPLVGSPFARWKPEGRALPLASVRLGPPCVPSKIVAVGDTTQVDLPTHAHSGLIDAIHRLREVRGVAAIKLTGADIVRHRLVQEIVRAYEEGPGKRH